MGVSPGRQRRVLVAIPTYNEKDNVRRLLQAILEAQPTSHVLVIDDCSPDGTGQIADEMAAADRRVFVLHRPQKLGLGTAYLAAFRFALDHQYEFVVQMDADFSHRVEDLEPLISAAQSADVAIGSRYAAGGRAMHRAMLRRLISATASWYARAMLGLPVLDCTSGFKCISRSALQSVDLDNVRSSGFGFQVEVNHLFRQAGLRLVEVPIVFPDREAGYSKMSMGIFLEAWWLVLKLRLARKPRVSSAAAPEASTALPVP